jgi:phage shock protein A
MSTRKTPDPDPVVTRIERVAELVRSLRSEVEQLRADNAALREQAAAARGRAAQLETERGTVRQRVRRMLDMINDRGEGAA